MQPRPGEPNDTACAQSGPSPILLVDHDRMSQRAFAELCASNNIRVDIATDLPHACNLSRTREYRVMALRVPLQGDPGDRPLLELQHANRKASIVILADQSNPTLPTSTEFREHVASIVPTPWEQDDLLPTLQRALRLRTGRSTIPPPPTGLPESVLLVEDCDTDAELVAALLSMGSSGYDVHRTTSLKGALQQLESATFDAIIVDLGLPDAGGIDAVLRLQTVAANVPLVVLSNHADDNVALEAVQAGAQDFLRKDAFDCVHNPPMCPPRSSPWGPPSPAEETRLPERSDDARCQFSDLLSFVKFVRFLRSEPPLSWIRWALCTRRSRIASAMVGSPM